MYDVVKRVVNGVLLGLVLLVAEVSYGQESGSKAPIVNAAISPDTIMIGDRFYIDVTIDKDITQAIAFPDFKDGKMNSQIEILEISAVDTLSLEGRDVSLKRRYTLTTFDEGQYGLGKFAMLYADKNVMDTIYSIDTLGLVVRTFEIDTLTQQIVDIKKPMHTPLVFAEIKNIVLWSLLGLALLAVAYYFFRRYQEAKRAKEDIRPKEPFYITALRMLEQLKSDNLCASAKYKQHYTRLTDILREYIDYRWDIGAMEMTSEEIVAAAVKQNLPKEEIERLKNIFSVSDLVKFAKLSPSEQDNNTTFNLAYHFIDKTKPMPLEEQEEPQEEQVENS